MTVPQSFPPKAKPRPTRKSIPQHRKPRRGPAASDWARDPDCSRCDLHESAVAHRCIPSRPADRCGSPTYSGQDTTTALLIVGEAPGWQEDRDCRCFVGRAGHTLHQVYIGHPKLYLLADIYLGNAVRCQLPREAKPNSGHYKACRPYLLADVALLQRHYPRVVILCVGTCATQQVLGLKATAAFRHQGLQLTSELEKPQ